ncbi:MAG: LPS-assembly protein LptD [Magnetospirillum sp.]|nr:LPS-assembly protein LptD [Magnetospirillum sp.]
MPASRHLLLISLLTASTALSSAARADTITEQKAWPEAGSWGQAWGEDDPVAARPAIPAPARPRPAATASPEYVPPPAAAALPRSTARPMAQPVQAGTGAATPLPSGEMGQAYPETGSWGQAWGEDEGPAPLPPRSTAIPSTIVGAPPPAAARPAARSASAPSPAISMTRSARRAERPAIITREENDEGDAVGLNRPPRVVPRAMRSRNATSADPEPVHMVADQVIYDREFNVVTAKGRVEMMHDGRTISADTVSYNLKADVMGASGNVVMTEPSGEITHAEYFELTGDFKNGVARDIRVILADNSRMAALTAQRIGGDRTDFDRAVYTACEPCRDDPDRTPLWQMKAERVTHNQAEAQVEYRDVWLEFAGIPVAYTPYMSHPDPTVKRQSGFLAPTFGMNSTLGSSIATPYFMVLSDSEDVTLAPRFMLDEISKFKEPNSTDAGSALMRRMQLSGQHRWRGIYGEAKTQASITADKYTGDIRGHLESKGLVELDSTWRAGWQVQHQSDQTYRQLYRVRMDEDRPWLLTRPYVEGFGRRNYAMMESLSFQGPRVVEDASKSPVVLPHMVYKTISSPGWAGSYWTTDSDMLAYTRQVGPSAQRLSSKVAWNLPLISPLGEVYTISTGIRGDGYHSDHVSAAGGGGGNIGRTIPEAVVNWRLPLSRIGTKVSQVIEPMVMVAASPIGGNDPRIPNEDSLDFELDETNVFRANRLPGLDRVEGGVRGAYGLRWAAYPATGGSIVAQAAQGWRAHPDSTYAAGSGFADTLSDYVGRVDVAPTPSTLSFHDRIRVDKDTLAIRRNEAGLSIGPPALNIGTAYGMLSPSTGIYAKRQYINYTASSQFSQFWRSSLSLQQDLVNSTVGGGTVNWTANAMYSDECFAVVGAFNRYHSDLPGLLSGYSMTLTVVLKSLGEAPVSVF